MSLVIVGSCSRITQNIVLVLAKQSLYQKISISDVLPTYDFHRRFYRLKRYLKDQKSTTQISINKIIKYDDLYHDIQRANDVLYVTHDYFQNVVSKTKLMELTATYSKHKDNVVFATPIQYDHYGYTNPQLNYLESQAKVRQIHHNANFVRSDVQDYTELYSYIGKSKNIIDDVLLKVPDSFRPKVVGSTFYAQQVVQTLKGGTKGQVICVRGQRQRHRSEVQHNKHLEDYELDHHKQNIRLLVSKYRGPQDKSSRIISYKF